MSLRRRKRRLTRTLSIKLYRTRAIPKYLVHMWPLQTAWASLFISVHRRQTKIPGSDIEVQSPESLSAKVQGMLSPATIKRDCSPPIVDLNKPLSIGFRSKALVEGGSIQYTKVGWRYTLPLQLPQQIALDDLCNSMHERISTIKAGEV